MPTFLRSSNLCTSLVNSVYADAHASLRLTGSSRHSTFLVLVILLTHVTAAGARAGEHSKPFILKSYVAAISNSSRQYKKRILMLRRNETQEGARFTLTSDSPLDDYKSFAEAERVCVMIPQAAFVSTRNETSGRGFADMRIEQRDEDVMLSFRLQQGATVAVNQNFNRLDVIFITNERANSKGLK